MDAKSGMQRIQRTLDPKSPHPQGCAACPAQPLAAFPEFFIIPASLPPAQPVENNYNNLTNGLCFPRNETFPRPPNGPCPFLGNMRWCWELNGAWEIISFLPPLLFIPSSLRTNYPQELNHGDWRRHPLQEKWENNWKRQRESREMVWEGRERDREFSLWGTGILLQLLPTFSSPWQVGNGMNSPQQKRSS